MESMTVTNKNGIEIIQTELATGIQLAKCRQCGCMEETLQNLPALLPSDSTDQIHDLARAIEEWAKEMEPVRYACLGCQHCYPAVAQNAFTIAFPGADQALSLSCDFQLNEAEWPPVVGEYFLADKDAAVAVSTLASVDLAETIAGRKPVGLAIAGKTETENIGLDKIVKNIVTNPSIRHLIVAGVDSQGHQSGRTLLALMQNGIDVNGRIIGSPGKRAVLRNVSAEEVQAFRSQIQIVDMIGCDDPEAICAQIETLATKPEDPSCCRACAAEAPLFSTTATPTVVASEPKESVRLDKAGYFVIVPIADRGVINVEYYDYDNRLLQIIEGTDSRDLYLTLVTNGWVTELSHAAYLGKELAKAELSLKFGFKYIQDGA